MASSFKTAAVPNGEGVGNDETTRRIDTLLTVDTSRTVLLRTRSDCGCPPGGNIELSSPAPETLDIPVSLALFRLVLELFHQPVRSIHVLKKSRPASACTGMWRSRHLEIRWPGGSLCCRGYQGLGIGFGFNTGESCHGRSNARSNPYHTHSERDRVNMCGTMCNTLFAASPNLQGVYCIHSWIQVDL